MSDRKMERAQALEHVMTALQPYAHLAVCEDPDCRAGAAREGFHIDEAWEVVARMGLLLHLIGTDDDRALRIMQEEHDDLVLDRLEDELMQEGPPR